MVDIDVETELRPVLSNDEKLIWTGKPRTGVVLRQSDFFLIPFSLFWFGFIIIWIIMVAKGGFIFSLLGIPGVLVGVYLVFGRFILDAMKRKNTIYGISSNRVIIKSGILSREIQSVSIKNIPELNFKVKSDGSGTLYLSSPRYPFMNNEYKPWMRQPPCLEFVENVQEVYNLLVQLQAK